MSLKVLAQTEVKSVFQSYILRFLCNNTSKNCYKNKFQIPNAQGPLTLHILINVKDLSFLFRLTY